MSKAGATIPRAKTALSGMERLKSDIFSHSRANIGYTKRMEVTEITKQILQSMAFYGAVIGLFRIAGKRLAGQTTTFDLLVLISIVVALQQATMDDSKPAKLTFVVTVFLLHLGFTYICLRFPKIRDVLRGRPTRLVSNGEVHFHALRQEGLSVDELKAGLRKAGVERVEDVRCAQLEETGQISAIRREE
jgi:uncharacterized membrane protein YcaP (DUF421 family)